MTSASALKGVDLKGKAGRGRVTCFFWRLGQAIHEEILAWGPYIKDVRKIFGPNSIPQTKCGDYPDPA